jgi:nucleotide-binding universal stress UspA family protein
MDRIQPSIVDGTHSGVPSYQTLAKAAESQIAAPAQTANGYDKQTTFGPSALDSQLPDVILDIPNISVDEISLDVFNVRAHISLEAKVAELVQINAGVDASIDNVNLTIRNVRANALLLVHLDNVREILDHALTAIAENPILIERLLDTVDTTVDTVGGIGKKILKPGGIVSRTVNMLGETIDHVVDTAGNIVEKVVAGPGEAPLSIEYAEQRYQEEVMEQLEAQARRHRRRLQHGMHRRRIEAPYSTSASGTSAEWEQLAPLSAPPMLRERQVLAGLQTDHSEAQREEEADTRPTRSHRHHRHHHKHRHSRGDSDHNATSPVAAALDAQEEQNSLSAFTDSADNAKQDRVEGSVLPLSSPDCVGFALFSFNEGDTEQQREKDTPQGQYLPQDEHDLSSVADTVVLGDQDNLVHQQGTEQPSDESSVQKKYHDSQDAEMDERDTGERRAPTEASAASDEEQAPPLGEVSAENMEAPVNPPSDGGSAQPEPVQAELSTEPTLGTGVGVIKQSGPKIRQSTRGVNRKPGKNAHAADSKR